MKIKTILAGLALPICLIGGCTTTGSSNNSALQREVSVLRAEVAELKASGRLAEMRGSGDLGGEINYLRTEVQQLSDNLDGSDQSGLTLRQQLDALNSRLDRLERKAGLNSSSSGYGRSGATAADGAYSPSRSSTGAYQPPESAAPTTVAEGPLTAGDSTVPLPPASGPYEEGKSLYEQRQYRSAIAKFKAYLSAEPKGGQAAEAQFYIGESLYAQQQYEEAILEYQKVVQSFPKSAQVPTSMLKQGMSFQAIGDKDSAKLLYQKVSRDYPKSYAAGLAGSRLKSI